MDEERIKGKVKWFDKRKGFGFIESEADPNIFVHYSAIIGRGYRGLQEGDEVEFEIETTPKGPAARAVKRLTTKFSNVQHSS